MRITGGELRGRRFAPPKERGKGGSSAPAEGTVRPTSERVREAIFSTLHSLGGVGDARVLDLYAGSGALGIEALSRGAASAVLVDREPHVCRTLLETIAEFGLTGRARVVPASLPDGLKNLRSGEFDLVFIDPPYDDHPGTGLIDQLSERGLLARGAMIVVESGGRTGTAEEIAAQYGTVGKEESPANLGETTGASPRVALVKERQYGDTYISYLRYE